MPFNSIVRICCVGLSIWAAPTPVNANDRATLPARDQLTNELRDSGLIQNENVLRVVHDTLRHRFVPSGVQANAYFDMALPIGHQQTISSPLIVAQMTQELDPQPNDRVLEIGTGSGYQAAILSPLVAEVYSIEIVEALGHRAMRTLKQLGYKNVFTKVGDGYQGWPDKAPFDKIIVTCSPHDVPQPLVDQLKEGGRLIIPVGERYQQVLYRMEKKKGALERKAIVPTLFVPMTGTAEASRPASQPGNEVHLVNGNFEMPRPSESSQSTKGDSPTPPTTTPPTTATTAPQGATSTAVGSPDGTGTSGPAKRGIPGWYYERQVELIKGSDATEGEHYARFKNTEPGRSAHLMQGLALDGQHIHQLELSAQFRSDGLTPGEDADTHPAVIITFYDRDRREVGRDWLGPWKGTHPWTTARETVDVPRQSREAIVRIGMFGAVGQLDIDDIELAVKGKGIKGKPKP